MGNAMSRPALFSLAGVATTLYAARQVAGWIAPDSVVEPRSVSTQRRAAATGTHTLLLVREHALTHRFILATPLLSVRRSLDKAVAAALVAYAALLIGLRVGENGTCASCRHGSSACTHPRVFGQVRTRGTTCCGAATRPCWWPRPDCGPGR